MHAATLTMHHTGLDQADTAHCHPNHAPQAWIKLTPHTVISFIVLEKVTKMVNPDAAAM
jgi:hypothetical protein